MADRSDPDKELDAALETRNTDTVHALIRTDPALYHRLMLERLAMVKRRITLLRQEAAAAPDRATKRDLLIRSDAADAFRAVAARYAQFAQEEAARQRRAEKQTARDLAVDAEPHLRNLRRHRLVAGLMFSGRVDHLTAAEIRELVVALDRALDSTSFDASAPSLEVWPDRCDPYGNKEAADA